MFSPEMAEEIKHRPYGVQVNFLLGNNTKLEIDELTSFRGTSSRTLQLKFEEFPIGRISENLNHLNHLQHDKNIKAYSAKVDGFANEEDAKNNGELLSEVLFRTAILHGLTLYIIPPCVPYKRGICIMTIEGRMELTISQQLNSSKLVEWMQEVSTNFRPVENKYLLSMELFMAARSEASNFARFIGLISALEALIEQKESNYPESLKEYSEKVINEFKEQLNTIEINDTQKDSLIGRISRELKRESIRQAMKRTIQELLSNEDAEVVDKAYCLRSGILHRGDKVPADISLTSTKIEQILRNIYENFGGVTG